MNPTTSDVVVVGAGIMGASCAWQMASRGLSVTVLESESAPAMGSTGRSAAGVRVQFTTAANVELSMYSIPVYREFKERYGFEVGYRAIGYLFLVPHCRWDQHLEAVALQKRLGAPVATIALEDAQRFVDFDPTGLAGATYGPWDGVVDPHMATHAWVSLGRRLGVDYRLSSPVTAIERRGSVWSVTSGGAVYECGHLVNTAGAWSGEVAAMAGLHVPVGPKRVQIFLSAPIRDPRTYPLTVDLETGVYVRSEGDRVLFGLDDHDQELAFTEGVEPEWLEHVLLTGAPRFPWWEDLGVDLKGSWWGYYGVTPDNSPIIGAHPEAENWIDACGFSGHGIMHAPATALAVSELVMDGEANTIGVSAFRHDRFGSEAAVEINVF